MLKTQNNTFMLTLFYFASFPPISNRFIFFQCLVQRSGLDKAFE